MTDHTAATLAARITAAVAALRDMGDALAASAALPDSADLRDGEDTWGPREVLAHVTEAAAYWHGEIERILAGDAAVPVPFGRAPDDSARVAILARDRSLPASVLLARLDREAAALAARVARLTGSELAREGLHPVRGVETVAAVIDRTLATHFEGHVHQVRLLLAG